VNYSKNIHSTLEIHIKKPEGTKNIVNLLKDIRRGVKKMICDKDKCTSCYACYNVCPKKCIKMEEDECGNIRPEINMDECIKCDLCRKTCPSINGVEFRNPKIAYAAWALDAMERRTSTSGGVASIFSNYIIENYGVVFGASIQDKINMHIKIDRKNDLIKLKGSKYVHSKIGDTYKEAKQELTAGRKVLFIGTPCQIAGIKNYLKDDYENLFTVDIICHGVPSQKILKDYIEEKFGDIEFNDITFRDDSGKNLRLLKDNKIVMNESMKESLYYTGFMNSLFCNESCYECMYAKSKRVSDVTIGDFLGLGKEIPFENPSKDGISVILPNTDKGLDLVQACGNKMFLEERSINEAVKGNNQLRRPIIKHENYDLFKRLYIKKGFNYAAERSRI